MSSECFSRCRCLHRPLRLLPAGATVAGRDSHPLKNGAFTAHFHSQLLCEQVVGRGLRRMDYAPDPETGRLTNEYVDIFGVPFSLIPFKGRQPQGGPPQGELPKHEVLALPERRAFEIRFPVVEGYVVQVTRNRVACNVEHRRTAAA